MAGTGHLQTEEILALVRSHNERETRLRRDYYAYLQTQEPQEESFEEHLQRYGFLVRLAEPAKPEEARELEQLAGVSLPLELRELYDSLGGLQVHNPVAAGIQLFPVPELLRRLRLPSGWERFRSLGLIHMMLASWSNDRPELEPGGLLRADEIERLNAAYKCVGWIPTSNGEGFRYIYFDGSGKLGTLRVHQDAFAELYSEDLLPMQTRSPADDNLSSIVITGLREAARVLDLFEGDEDDDEEEDE